MVFKNPICSLPDVGGCGGGSEGSLSTVTRHWKEIAVSQKGRTWFSTQCCSLAGKGTRNPRSQSLSGGEVGSCPGASPGLLGRGVTRAWANTCSQPHCRPLSSCRNYESL